MPLYLDIFTGTGSSPENFFMGGGVGEKRHRFIGAFAQEAVYFWLKKFYSGAIERAQLGNTLQACPLATPLNWKY